MNILYVEDDPINRRVVADMLAVMGATLDEAENAEIGLQRVRETPYDIILMDIRMPGMDGVEAMRHIRAMESQNANAPIIVITADAKTGLAEECKSVGADKVLTKPVAMNELLESIGAVYAESESSELMFE